MSDDPVLPDWLPDAHFSTVGAGLSGLPYDGEDPEDEELAETPPEVKMLLGFDPADIDWNEDDTDLCVVQGQLSVVVP